MDLEDNNLEIITVPSSNPSHEQTPVAAASPAASSVPQDESRGLNEMTPEDLDSLKKQVLEYADKDRWKEAEPIFNKYPDMVRIPLTRNEDRALHVAVKANSINFVKGLVNLMTPQDLEIRKSDDPDTAFSMAAESGKSDLVQIMIEKNQNLPLIGARQYWRFPVHWAAIGGHHKIVQDLSSKTLLQKMEKRDPYYIEQLFFLTIEHDMFDVATNVFEEYPAFLATKTWTRLRGDGSMEEEEYTALEMLLRKPSKELSTTGGNNTGASSGESLQLLQKVWLQLISQLGWTKILERIRPTSLVKAMADALKSGNVEAVKWLLSKNPELFSITNDDNNGQNILHCAVRHRQNSIVSLIKAPNDILLAVDREGNSVLHYAAYPLEIEESSSSSRATTRMATEVAWFKKQEKKFPRQLRTMKTKRERHQRAYLLISTRIYQEKLKIQPKE